MNDIILPMKVHAVKLEYRRLMLENMPHGHFAVKKGVWNVVITYDPDQPKYNTRYPRTLYVSSKLGRKYTEIINNYLKIKSEYELLLASWKSLYNVAPPRIRFPIKQFSDPHGMNNDFFNRQPEHCGKYIPDNPTESEFGELKSKNELMGADILKLMDIPFKYETKVTFVETNETINPDYLINFYEIDRCAYLEILGMNDKGDYSMRTASKINGFSRSGYRPGREVIYVLLYDKANFDRDYFVSQVLSAFNDMIPDSALVWDTKPVYSIKTPSSDESWGNPTLGDSTAPAC